MAIRDGSGGASPYQNRQRRWAFIPQPSTFNLQPVQGRHFRLTDVHGELVKGLLA